MNCPRCADSMANAHGYHVCTRCGYLPEQGSGVCQVTKAARIPPFVRRLAGGHDGSAIRPSGKAE